MHIRTYASTAMKVSSSCASSSLPPSPAPAKRSGGNNTTTTTVVFLTLGLALLTIIPLYLLPLLGSYFTTSTPERSVPEVAGIVRMVRGLSGVDGCDVFRGEWVPNPSAPYYTNETCWAIHDNQNCMMFGRPDAAFLKWRWSPAAPDCDLPPFNPAQFLELMRGKKLAFLGDSVGRNQMQSLMCLLLRVTYAKDVSPAGDSDKSRRWFFSSHDFILANIWSPYLVRSEEVDPNGPTHTGLFRLHLDEPDPSWAAKIAEFDIVIVSAGHWFFRPTMYFEGGHLVGCHYCLDKNVTDLTLYYGYRRAFRTTFETLIGLNGYKGLTILRTFLPSHFEGGEWDKGGDCRRTRPVKSTEARLEGLTLQMYMTQLEEFRAAERKAATARRPRVEFRLLDATEAMLLRPDGHPGRYGHRREEKVQMANDCVHWCLPGPIDVLNDFLLHMVKLERGRSASMARLRDRAFN